MTGHYFFFLPTPPPSETILPRNFNREVRRLIAVDIIIFIYRQSRECGGLFFHWPGPGPEGELLHWAWAWG